MPATTPESPIRPRYHMLDAVRGFVLVHMVAFHFCFDWFVLFAGRVDWPTLPAVFWWERFICCTFNLVSGMAFHLGRRHLYHSLLLNAVGTGVTAVTLLIMPEQAVWFGVLSLLGWLRLWPGLRVNLPGWLYASRWTAVLGFPPAGFYSSDYFPLLPWLFLFWVGYYLWLLIRSRKPLQRKVPVFSALGRLCLPVYVVHQPVCYGLCMAARWLGLV